MQWLTSGEWGCPLNNGPKLAMGLPNSSWKKKVMHTWSLFSAKSLIVSGILLRYASVSIHVRNIWVSIIEHHLNVETEPN